MPEEKEKIMDSMFGRVVATLLASLLVIVIGHGLIIWKNQDSFDSRLLEAEKDIALVVDINNRIIKLESYKVEAFSRITKVEDHVIDTSMDRSTRGGSFRRDDADKMKQYLLDKIDIGSDKISTLEYKMNNIEGIVSECKANIPNYALKEHLRELEDEVEELEDEFETSYEELTEQCKNVIDLLEYKK